MWDLKRLKRIKVSGKWHEEMDEVAYYLSLMCIFIGLWAFAVTVIGSVLMAIS